MKFTVFGSEGFVGSHLTKSLRFNGNEVACPGRGLKDTNWQDLGHAIYAIGLTADFRSRPYDTITAHVSLVSEILRTAKFESFLYLSSTRIYGRQEETDEKAMLSVSPANPSDLYNLSKLAGEAICLNSGHDNVRIARLSNVIGPSESRSDTFIGALCREASNGHITLQTALDSCKDYIWIDDAVNIMQEISARGQQTIYNVASGRQTSNESWVKAISTKMNCTYSVAMDAQSIILSPIQTSRIEAEFGFHSCNVQDHLESILQITKPNALYS